MKHTYYGEWVVLDIRLTVIARQSNLIGSENEVALSLVLLAGIVKIFLMTNYNFRRVKCQIF